MERTQPGKLSYAIEVSSGIAAMIGRYLNKAAGMQMVEVPYKTSAQANQDTVSGRTQMIISSVATVQPFVRAGKLRTIASTAEKRMPHLPDVPTVSEILPGFVVSGWFCLAAPAGTPNEIVQRLNREAVAIARQPQFEQRLKGLGLLNLKLATQKETADFVRMERQRWGSINKAIGTQPQ